MNLMDQIWFHHFITWWFICGIAYAITAIIALNTTDTKIRDEKPVVFLIFTVIVCILSGMLGFGFLLYNVIRNFIKWIKR